MPQKRYDDNFKYIEKLLLYIYVTLYLKEN